MKTVNTVGQFKLSYVLLALQVLVTQLLSAFPPIRSFLAPSPMATHPAVVLLHHGPPAQKQFSRTMGHPPHHGPWTSCAIAYPPIVLSPYHPPQATHLAVVTYTTVPAKASSQARIGSHEHMLFHSRHLFFFSTLQSHQSYFTLLLIEQEHFLPEQNSNNCLLLVRVH
jgi:hypothetical protein